MSASPALTGSARKSSNLDLETSSEQMPLDVTRRELIPAGEGRGLSQAMLNVLEFHRAFNLPRSTRPRFVNDDLATLRLDLLREEVAEFADATAIGDLIGIADALADIIYVTYGAALSYGIDLDAAVSEVHRSNMSKLDRDGRPVLRSDGKVLKSDQYSAPDLTAVLRRQPDLPT